VADACGHDPVCRLHKQRDHAVGHDAYKRAAPESSRADSTAQGSALPIGAEPVNLNPADFTADITRPNWPMKPRWLQKMAPARSASPIRNRHRSHDYGSLSIIVKSLLLCES
jgi:hypothetical protein